MGWPCCARSKISIHALREEGDATVFASSAVKTYFNPRPPRGGRPSTSANSSEKLIFQSTPSARRATRSFWRPAPAAGISIHALREEGDGRSRPIRPLIIDFNPRPPRGGRPLVHDGIFDPRNISIHALREEGDVALALNKVGGSSISIHALREEGDRSYMMASSTHEIFQSTPSARRATLIGVKSSPACMISIHALREEGDTKRLL